MTVTTKNALSKATKKRLRAIELLSDGKKHTVMHIAFACRIGDPRSVIRDIRELGIEVKDEWVEADGSRFKRYWIERSYQDGQR